MNYDTTFSGDSIHPQNQPLNEALCQNSGNSLAAIASITYAFYRANRCQPSRRATTTLTHLHPLPSPIDPHALIAHAPVQFPYLLQSSGDAGWDILFALPGDTRRYTKAEGKQLFNDLAAIPLQPQTRDHALPFTGGWFVYLGYEWLETLEPSVARRAGDALPLALLARIPAAILHDRVSKQSYVVSETLQQQATILNLIAAATSYTPAPVNLTAIQEDEPQAFLDGVLRCKRYIADGDVFQVNLSRGWDAALAAGTDALAVYAKLRQANPAPFSAWVDLGQGQHLLSSSPERLVSVNQHGRVETRPIAGTHPRSPDAAEDARQKARLLASSKERAEHIMLIDLERNDLGRIAVPGSVKVDALMDVTTYAFVHHIESTVSCQLRAGLTVADLARALFPGGTITGCPKVRTMQIIRELEDRPRYAYTGSLGYINHDGSLDWNILIRTIMHDNGELYFRAGGGIVADSDPERELAETRAKARGLLRALGVDG